MRRIAHQAHGNTFRVPTRQLLDDIHLNLTRAITAASCQAVLRPVLDGLFAVKRDIIALESRLR
jgi:hypothetical protein